MKKNNLEEFIYRSNEVHNKYYDYSKFNYINSAIKSTVICPVHGEFEISANHHIQGTKCRKCAYMTRKTRKFDQNHFINLCQIMHNKYYDYSDVVYVNSRTKIIIICPSHGRFEQKADSHLRGNGCKICNQSLGEKEIEKTLDKLSIKFIREKKFEECFNKLCLPFDFYLIDYNLCIEFDGIQHFKPLKFFGEEDGFNSIKKNDEIKNKYCFNNGIDLLRIPYLKIKEIEKIIKIKLKL
jgi:hypothetical protein